MCGLNTERLNESTRGGGAIVCLDNDLCRLAGENNIMITRAVFAETFFHCYFSIRAHARAQTGYAREITGLEVLIGTVQDYITRRVRYYVYSREPN